MYLDERVCLYGCRYSFDCLESKLKHLEIELCFIGCETGLLVDLSPTRCEGSSSRIKNLRADMLPCIRGTCCCYVSFSTAFISSW